MAIETTRNTLGRQLLGIASTNIYYILSSLQGTYIYDGITILFLN